MTTRVRTRGSAFTLTGGSFKTIISGTHFNNPKWYAWQGSAQLPGTYTGSAGSRVDVGDNRESMSDIIGLRDSENPCVHNVWRMPAEAPRHVSLEYKEKQPPYGVAQCLCPAAHAIYYTNSLGTEAVPAGYTVADARVPQVSPDMLNGLVSLAELRDVFTGLSNTIGHLLTAALEARHPSQRRSFAKSLYNQYRNNWRGLLEALVGADLSWKFGYSQLLSDINKTRSALGRVEKRLAQKALKFKVHGRFVDSRSSTSVLRDWDYGSSSLDLSYYRVTRKRKTTVTWTTTCIRQVIPSKLPSLDQLAIDATVEALGLNKTTLNTLWAVLPRSFIVDMVFPIGTYLESVEGLSPDATWFKTLRTIRSSKSVTEYTFATEVSPPPPSAIYQSSYEVTGRGTMASDFTVTEYTRSDDDLSNYEPIVPYVPMAKTPSWASLWSVAEIVLARALNLPRGRGPSGPT